MKNKRIFICQTWISYGLFKTQIYINGYQSTTLFHRWQFKYAVTAQDIISLTLNVIKREFTCNNLCTSTYATCARGKWPCPNYMKLNPGHVMLASFHFAWLTIKNEPTVYITSDQRCVIIITSIITWSYSINTSSL